LTNFEREQKTEKRNITVDETVTKREKARGKKKQKIKSTL